MSAQRVQLYNEVREGYPTESRNYKNIYYNLLKS